MFLHTLKTLKTNRWPLLWLLLAGLLLIGSPAHARQSSAPAGELPLLFVENVGQFAPDIRFSAGWGNHQLSLTDDAMWLTVLAPVPAPTTPDNQLETTPPAREAVTLKLSFTTAAPSPLLIPFAPLDSRITYLTRPDSAAWQQNVPVWGGVRYEKLLPGLALELSGDNGQLALRWVADAAADPEAITRLLRENLLTIEGADAVEVSGGQLILSTAIGPISLPLPSVVDAAGQPLSLPDDAAPFIIESTENAETVEGKNSLQIAFPVAPPQAGLAATIGAQAVIAHPQLGYSTFLGGNGALDTALAVAVDEAGHAYVTGQAYPGFPTTPGAFDTTIDGVFTDAFVAKLSPDGSQLLYATFVGGSDFEAARAIAVDAAGQATISGYTTSSDFPATAGAWDESPNNASDAFVARLTADGSELVYATLLGGNDIDLGWAMTTDSQGAAYVTGYTQSTNFPTTPNAFNTTQVGGDAFVTKLSPDGSSLIYSSRLGGNRHEHGYSIAVDEAGHAYVTGQSGSTDFPATPGAFSATLAGEVDTFVAKIATDGSGLLYATLLGGSDYDSARAIAVDAAGYAHITGFTESTDFPTTPGSFDPTCEGCEGALPININAFVTRLTPTGSGLAYSSFLGGDNVDYGYNIAINQGGQALVSGYTASANFPTTADAFDPTCEACAAQMAYTDAFLARISSNGTTLNYSTFVGGADNSDRSYGLAVRGPNNVYLAGGTNAADFPVTENGLDTSLGNFADGFVTHLILPAATPPQPAAPTCAPWALGQVVVGDSPRGVAVDSERQRVYVANYGSDSISVINGNTLQVIDTIFDISGPTGLALDPSRHVLWVSNYDDDQVTAIAADSDAYSVLKVLDVGAGPWGVAYNPVDDTVNVANSNDDSVSIIGLGQLNNPTVVSVISESISRPYHLAANPLTGKLYVANSGSNSVTVIVAGQVLTVVPLYDSARPYGIAIDETRGLAYVATSETPRIVTLAAGDNDDRFLGWAAFYRGFGDRNRPVPLRAIAVNPNVAAGDGGHLWATTATVDGSEADQALLIPKGWPGGFHLPIAGDVAANPTDGIAIDRSSGRVYVSGGQAPGILTVTGDHNSLCPDWFAHTADAEQPALPDANRFEFEVTTAESLLRSDLNGDNQVDIQDLVLVAGHYGSNDPTADINDDGAVDIFDLVIIANSFSR